MRRPEINKVEVDMVPLIDIISLLLMFLIIVGDTTANTSNIRMKLPVADQAKSDWGRENEGRIVIQLKTAGPRRVEFIGKYCAVFNGARHSTEDASKSLKAHLQRYLDDELAHGRARNIPPDNALDIAVKLRIPENCPMVEAENVMVALAQVNLVNIQYAASSR